MTVDEQTLALGRRAIACTAWRWLPGMLTSYGVRIFGHSRRGEPFGHATGDGGRVDRYWLDDGDTMPDVPDLRDAATVGSVLALIREATGDGGAMATTVQRHGEVTWVAYAGLGIRCEAPTEAEALVLGLEQAPSREGAGS